MFRAVLLCVLMQVPGLSMAQGRPVDANITYGYAQVLRVAPVHGMARGRVPEQPCQGRDGDSGARGAIVGAIVGGVLANQVGKGDGRKAATVAGTVAGGVIGRRVERNKNSGGSAPCQAGAVEREERHIIGYDVEYQFKGEKYMSRLDSDPGNRLRVRVSVVPDTGSAGTR